MTEQNGLERSSATEELRRLLDERGVEWWQSANTLGCVFTRWYSPLFGDEVCAMENGEEGLVLFDHFMTPEQVVAATLGGGTCNADETDTWECVRDDLGGYGKTLTVHVMECTECGHTYEHVNGSYEFCPRCGRKVVDA